MNPADLDAEFHRLVTFGAHVARPGVGAAWLDDDGRPDAGRPTLTYVTARMAHVHALAAIAGVASSAPIADLLLDALVDGPLRDAAHGGWHSSTAPAEWDKSAYDHAFVVLAASTATVAGRPAGPVLLADALAALDRFWEPGPGMVADAFDRTWTRCEPYRGLNANMHTVEALLAAADATGDPEWRARAARIAQRTVESGRATGWRLCEHFTPDWRPTPDHHRDRPDHPFRPFGATVGHGLEWARLLLHLDADRLLPASVALYDRAVADGWAADGADGFVYTTDWDGRPVVHDRMHWVLAEAVAAAAVLHTATGEGRYAHDRDRFWAHARRFHLDLERGSWIHQLDRHNRPASSVWAGKPDLYHAVQATLIPRSPLEPGLAAALAARHA